MPLLVVTLSEEGAWRSRAASASRSPPSRSSEVVDTTGAGDLFAAGFLHGQARAADWRTSLRLGAICAAECIGHYGPSPIADLKDLARG